MGLQGVPLLLTDPNTVSPETLAYLTANKSALSNFGSWLFGGPAAVSTNVEAAISGALA